MALLGAVLAVAGCGGDDEGEPIPADTAAQLQQELDGVQARLDNGSEGACRDILEGPRGPNIERIRELLDSLPGDVDADVRSALEDSFDRLWELVEQECEDLAEEEEPEPTPTVTETVPTETVPPPTETETEPEEEEPAPPAEEELPPEGDGDNEGGVPGVGNGGGVGPG